MTTQTEEQTISYVAAIRQALGDMMAEDESVFIYGEDVGGTFGGAFKATKGLAERFPGRVLNSPIAEDAITGVAIGAALEGARPVIEFQFADFASIAFNQLVNHAGAFYWRNGRPCPITARFPVGGTPGGGPYHSQMPEAWLTNHPGLVVVAPSTVADAYGMLKDSIRCNDPVIFCEHKYLYNHLKEPFDPALPVAPLGAAVVRRPGRDVTLVSYSAMVHDCLAAAEGLMDEAGISVEVIDLRCLRPLDMDTILASVSRTSRLVVATEAWPYGSVAAEVVSAVAQLGFHLLDAPPKRICAIDTPIPYHPRLWAAHRPDARRIMAAVEETVRF
ncbi:MAG: alpha-ketoacid dehydrogenase subunit beta [Planctomycetota bacterium]|nr:MAG: alpha-ketoacid dehydrogenase subunit beta [Planctomycetota bacterium]